MSAEILRPVIDDEVAPFFEGAKEGELRLQECADCETLRFPPRPMCPHCRSTERRWRAVSGRGTIWSFVVAHPPLLPQFGELAPYPVVCVELEEGASLRLVGNLVTGPGEPINSVDPTTIEIGEPVRVVFDALADDVHVPRWVRA